MGVGRSRLGGGVEEGGCGPCGQGRASKAGWGALEGHGLQRGSPDASESASEEAPSPWGDPWGRSFGAFRVDVGLRRFRRARLGPPTLARPCFEGRRCLSSRCEPDAECLLPASEGDEGTGGGKERTSSRKRGRVVTPARRPQTSWCARSRGHVPASRSPRRLAVGVSCASEARSQLANVRKCCAEAPEARKLCGLHS